MPEARKHRNSISDYNDLQISFISRDYVLKLINIIFPKIAKLSSAKLNQILLEAVRGIPRDKYSITQNNLKMIDETEITLDLENKYEISYVSEWGADVSIKLEKFGMFWYEVCKANAFYKSSGLIGKYLDQMNRVFSKYYLRKCNLHIKIKPNFGDDYSYYLKQIKTSISSHKNLEKDYQNIWIIIYKNYVSSTKLEIVQKIFANENILLIDQKLIS